MWSGYKRMAVYQTLTAWPLSGTCTFRLRRFPRSSAATGMSTAS